jgi:hypothetical protein
MVKAPLASTLSPPLKATVLLVRTLAELETQARADPAR